MGEGRVRADGLLAFAFSAWQEVRPLSREGKESTEGGIPAASSIQEGAAFKREEARKSS